jgi:hypothetical protein
VQTNEETDRRKYLFEQRKKGFYVKCKYDMNVNLIPIEVMREKLNIILTRERKEEFGNESNNTNVTMQ